MVHRSRVVALIAAAAGLLTIVATSRGPGLSPDSMEYITGGVNLANGSGITGTDGAPITVFPPALSVVAALGEKSSLVLNRVFDAAWAINYFTPEKVEELGKDSPSGPSDASTSGSPSPSA